MGELSYTDLLVTYSSVKTVMSGVTSNVMTPGYIQINGPVADVQLFKFLALFVHGIGWNNLSDF